MAPKKKLLHFKQLASRLNGVQIPIFGVQWTPPEPERKVVRDVLTVLEDRRVLYNPCAWELEDEVIQSVLRIRDVLTDAIQRMCSEGRRVLASQLPPDERRYDIGNFPSYFETFVEFALADAQYGPGLRATLERLLRTR